MCKFPRALAGTAKKKRWLPDTVDMVKVRLRTPMHHWLCCKAARDGKAEKHEQNKKPTKKHETHMAKVAVHNISTAIRQRDAMDPKDGTCVAVRSNRLLPHARRDI